MNIMAAMSCLFLSTIYHTFSSKNEVTAKLLVRLDYAGVSLLILGSSFAPVHYSFACGSAHQIGVLLNTAMTFICLTAFIITVLPVTNQKGCHKLRMVVFLTAGILGILPLTVNMFYEP